MPARGNSQNDKTHNSEEVLHILPGNSKNRYKTAVIISILKGHKSLQKGTWTPVQGGLPGKVPAEPTPGGREDVTSGKREELGQRPWLKDLPFQTNTLPSSSDLKARPLVYPRSGS